MGVARSIAALVLVASATPRAVKSPPEIFHATFEYDYASLTGEITRRERVAGTYTRDLETRTAVWTDVTVAAGRGVSAFGAPDPQDFMQRFTYPLKPSNATTEEFFHGIPPAAVQERNLVWDTRMFEIFGEDEWAHLKANTPYHFERNHDVALAGAGTFTNNDVQLTLTGTTVRNGQECLVVDYVALFNGVRLSMPGEALVGRSHYWGQVWVAKSSKHIEAATLYEDVLGEVTLANGPASPVNVFRIGTLERVRAQ